MKECAQKVLYNSLLCEKQVFGKCIDLQKECGKGFQPTVVTHFIQKKSFEKYFFSSFA